MTTCFSEHMSKNQLISAALCFESQLFGDRLIPSEHFEGRCQPSLLPQNRTYDQEFAFLNETIPDHNSSPLTKQGSALGLYKFVRY